MTEIVDTIVMSRHSIMQRIRNSPELAKQFQDTVDKIVVDDVKLRNLSNALHRFDSLLRPLFRGVILLEPLIVTAHWVAIQRQGQEVGNDAADFLQFVSGAAGIERLLLMAMMADAGDMCEVLLRYFDTEDSDAAIMTRQIDGLVSKIDWAFVKRKVLTLKDSCTAIMLQKLSSVHVSACGHTFEHW